MRYSKDKTINAVVAALIKSGAWHIKQGRHLRVEHNETHRCLTVPRTPSDHRAAQNWLHQVKHLGAVIEARR